MSALVTPQGRAAPYRQSADAVLAALGTDARLGLSEAEARRRLDQYGMNELAAGPAIPAWRKILAQFTSDVPP